MSKQSKKTTEKSSYRERRPSQPSQSSHPSQSSQPSQSSHPSQSSQPSQSSHPLQSLQPLQSSQPSRASSLTPSFETSPRALTPTESPRSFTSALQLVERRPSVRLPSSLAWEQVPEHEEENIKLRTEVEELKKINARLEEELQTMEFLNEEFVKQEHQFKEKIATLEGQLRALHSEPIVVIPSRSVLPPKSVSPADSSNSESAEDQLSQQKRRIQPAREKKGKGKAIAEDESDPKEARAEMKVLMKTIPEDYQLRVDEVYSSSENKKILSRLIPELLNSMAPRFNPSRKQLHEWLGALHRHQRGRYRKKETGKLDADNRRLHANSRLNEKRARRIKSAQSLINQKSKKITKYGDELIDTIKETKVHSPEESETDPENPEKRQIIVYDYNWRSNEFTNLLRRVLDDYSKTIQGIQPSRRRNYSKDLYDATPPEGLPNWAYSSKGKAEEKKSAGKPKKRKIIEYEEYDESDSEKHQTGESAIMGEIRGAIAKAKSTEKGKGTKKQPEKGTQSTKKKRKMAQSKTQKFGKMKSMKGKERVEEEEEEEEDEDEETSENE